MTRLEPAESVSRVQLAASILGLQPDQFIKTRETDDGGIVVIDPIGRKYVFSEQDLALESVRLDARKLAARSPALPTRPDGLVRSPSQSAKATRPGGGAKSPEKPAIANLSRPPGQEKSTKTELERPDRSKKVAGKST